MQALELASIVEKGLSFRPLPDYLWMQPRVVDLSVRRYSDGCLTAVDDGEATIAAAPALPGDDGAEGEEKVLGPEHRLLLTCPNPDESNSAVEVSFQVRW